MFWCHHCNDDIGVQRDPDTGYTCCLGCGKIIDQDMFYNGPTFEKDSGGTTKVTGIVLRSVQGIYSVSRERTLNKGKYEITDIVNCLQVGGGESIINEAHAFYKIAVDKNFTRGRRTSHVAAVCLYIACRQNEKAYLLIDFTDYLQTNVYVLGAVFLQFCKVLSIEEHPIIRKLVDPSLFIHRFTERLLGRSDKKKEVSETALRIVASMKRDWMQTGRKPSGLCGAALYISALSHGLSYSKSDIVTVVHICEATLTKRLIEFENTESGFLTIEEFDAKASEFDTESHSNQLPKSGEVLCEHKDTQEPHFAHGLCRNCYNDFFEISGGLQGGADPPAFQHAERLRTKKTKAEEKRNGASLDTQPCDLEHGFIHDKKDFELSPNVSSDAIGCESPASKGPESSGHQADDTFACNESQYPDIDDEQESLSDIDDAEVDGYLHNEEEKRYKTIIWEEMNKEYLEEQAAKEAAAAVAKEGHDANLANGFDAETATTLTKSRKERRQRCAEGARNSAPAQTPTEATSQMLKRKGLSSKINYKALESLYNSDQEAEKKQKTETDAGDADGQLDSIEEENLLDAEGAEDCDEPYTFEDGYYEGDGYDGYYGNGGEGYGNNEEYDYEY